MRRLYLFLMVSLILSVYANAQQENQTQGGQIFTLEQCITYSLENSINVKNAVLDEQIASARVKETRGIGLPQVDASVTLQHNEKLPRFFATYDPNMPGFFDFSGVPGIEAGDVVA